MSGNPPRHQHRTEKKTEFAVSKEEEEAMRSAVEKLDVADKENPYK